MPELGGIHHLIRQLWRSDDVGQHCGKGGGMKMSNLQRYAPTSVPEYLMQRENYTSRWAVSSVFFSPSPFSYRLFYLFIYKIYSFQKTVSSKKNAPETV